MSKEQKGLIIKARAKYGRIFPCSNNTSWAHCFSRYNGKVYFWFNTEDHSTHAVVFEPEKRDAGCSIRD